MIGVVLAIAAIAAYYFLVYKPKKDKVKSTRAAGESISPRTVNTEPGTTAGVVINESLPSNNAVARM